MAFIGRVQEKIVDAYKSASAPLYNLRNHWIVSQRAILIAAASPDVERGTNG